MPSLNVSIAAYETLEHAMSDWSDFERTVVAGGLVDGALIERTAVEVTGFHFCAPSGWGRGVIACAVCGVLWPPAMLVGALAGGVGCDVMTEVRSGLSGDSVRDLGAVLEVGSFVAVAITDSRRATLPDELGRHALARCCVPLRSTPNVLVGALRSDQERDR